MDKKGAAHAAPVPCRAKASELHLRPETDRPWTGIGHPVTGLIDLVIGGAGDIGDLHAIGQVVAEQAEFEIADIIGDRRADIVRFRDDRIARVRAVLGQDAVHDLGREIVERRILLGLVLVARLEVQLARSDIPIVEDRCRAGPGREIRRPVAIERADRRDIALRL